MSDEGSVSAAVEPGAEMEAMRARVVELEAVAARVVELEGAAGRVAELEAALAAAGEAHATAMAVGAEAHRAALLSGAPLVPAELVTGATVLEVAESFGRAKGIVDRIASAVRAGSGVPSVPGGAPGRVAPDLSALSPLEKIRVGLGSGNGR